MNRESLNKLSDAQLASVAFTAMQLGLQRHAQFLQHVAIVRLTGAVALRDNNPTTSPTELISRQVAAEPGRFTDPRIEKLPLELSNRLVDLVKQLQAKPRPADFSGEEVCALIDEVKKFDADMQPIYDWHEETRRALQRVEASLN